MKKTLITIFFLVPMAVFSQTQFHLGQYTAHQPFINPASMGANMNINGAIFHKSQWNGLEGAPKFQGFNINSPIKGDKNFIGLTAVHDQIGINKRTEFSTSYAYKLKPTTKSKLALSLTSTINFVSSDYNQIDVFDAYDPSFTNQRQSVVLPNFKFSAYYFINKFHIGFSAPNLLENKLSLFNSDDKAVVFNTNAVHFFLNAGYRTNIGSSTELLSSILIKEVAGAPLQIDGSLQFFCYDKFGGGLSYRTSKELLATASVNITEQVMLCYGYEMNFSELRNYSNGTHEIILKFEIQKEKRVPMLSQIPLEKFRP